MTVTDRAERQLMELKNFSAGVEDQATKIINQ